MFYPAKTFFTVFWFCRWQEIKCWEIPPGQGSLRLLYSTVFSRISMLSANTVIIPPTAIYFSFQTTCKPPELCVRVDSLQPQISITPCFMNGKKERQGINLKTGQSKAENSNVWCLAICF